MLTITVRHHFSAGHRILGLTGPGAKCRNLHGHTFGVEWTFVVTDTYARTIEFGNVKAAVRGWVDQHLDHGYLVDYNDDVLRHFLEDQQLKHHVMGGPPTTEAIASMLAKETQHLLPAVGLVRVLVTEGPSNAAAWEHTPGKAVGE